MYTVVLQRYPLKFPFSINCLAIEYQPKLVTTAVGIPVAVAHLLLKLIEFKNLHVTIQHRQGDAEHDPP